MALNLTSSRKTLLFTVLVVVATIIGLALIYMQAVNLLRLQEEVEIEEMALEQARVVLNIRLEHKVNAPVYQEKYEWLKLKIPDNPEEEEILRYFDYLSEEYEISVSEIRFGGRSTNQEGGYIQMPLAINVEGRYRNLVGLLDHLNRGDRAIRIDNIVITVLSAETVELRIILSTNAFHEINQ